MIAKECCISTGIGISKKGLPSFDKALLDAGVGNYNLVRLSSILPAIHTWVDAKDIEEHIVIGSLLPTAYSTITSDSEGDILVSSIGVGIPKDKTKVGVIMEYSAKNISEKQALQTLVEMIEEAFEVRGWELERIIKTAVSVKVEEQGTNYTTFACIAEW